MFLGRRAIFSGRLWKAILPVRSGEARAEGEVESDSRAVPVRRGRNPPVTVRGVIVITR